MQIPSKPSPNRAAQRNPGRWAASVAPLSPGNIARSVRAATSFGWIRRDAGGKSVPRALARSGAVEEPAQHQNGLLPARQSASAGPSTPADAFGGEQPGQELHGVLPYRRPASFYVPAPVRRLLDLPDIPTVADGNWAIARNGSLTNGSRSGRRRWRMAGRCRGDTVLRLLRGPEPSDLDVVGVGAVHHEDGFADSLVALSTVGANAHRLFAGRHGCSWAVVADSVSSPGKARRAEPDLPKRSEGLRPLRPGPGTLAGASGQATRRAPTAIPGRDRTVCAPTSEEAARGAPDGTVWHRAGRPGTREYPQVGTI